MAPNDQGESARGAGRGARGYWALIRLWARIVPLDERGRWRNEWLAEIEHARTAGASGTTLLRRCLVSAPRDAMVLRRRRRRGPEEEKAGAGLTALVDATRQDIRYGARSLWSAPGFTVVAVLTMALGIGATTTIFSLVNGILLRPLPYPASERLVLAWPQMWFSTSLFLELDGFVDSYDAVAGFTGGEHAVVGPDGAVRVAGPRVTAGFFEVLQPRMTLGRGFRPGDDAPGTDALVISHAFWRDFLGADPKVLGRALRVDGTPRRVVGVLPAGFDVLQNHAAVVLPWVLDPEAPGATSQDMKLIGRLAPGATAGSARDELHAYIGHLEQLYGFRSGLRDEATVAPLRDYLVGDTRPTLILLFGAVALTLLIATANVANLMLSRAVARGREMGVRVALGAGSGRLVRQTLAESTLLGLLGAGPGVGLALVGLPAVVAWLPESMPRTDGLTVDGVVLAFSVGVALVTGWLVGLVPALHACRTDVRAALAAGARAGGESRARRRTRTAIVVAEVALAVTLVAGSGLLIKSFLQVLATDPGLQPDGLVTFDLRPERGTIASWEEAELYFGSVRSELSAIPGVASVTEIWKVPFGEDGGINGLYRADVPIDREVRPPMTRWRPVRPGYFTTTGMRLLQGRLFEDGDLEGAEPVAVVTRAAARTLFGDGEPLGQRILTSIENELPVRIVGVVADLRLGGLDQESPAVVYRPYAQLGSLIETFGFYGRWIMLRLAGPPPGDLATTVRDTVRAIDPTALVAGYTTMGAAIGASIAGRRVTMSLLALFAATSLLLGAIGIYGVLAYSVRARRREIGIRVALGASRGRIVADVLGDAARLAVIGCGAGLLLTLALSRAIESFLFQVDPLDPATLGLAVATAVAVALGSALHPAVRAGRQDPARTLSSDD